MTNKEIMRFATRKFDFVNTIGMKFRLIPTGPFMMGSENGQTDERPVHKVTITKTFYIGIYPVTQAEYEAIMGTNSSEFRGNIIPVGLVTWYEAKEFCRRLSEKEGRTYRLPTEAEWEYACRAGTTTEYYWGDSIDGRYAWYNDNSARQIHPVGQKLPNAWGLYDMLGNVYEWCEDWYDRDYYSRSPRTDPAGPSWGLFRVLRGGSWSTYADYIRGGSRLSNDPSERYFNVGFRVVVDELCHL
ncbi:MAG: formylglycine-generating enzyme family protein [Candidatus Omnitrophota bacterium]|nr:MAG: formylglycine-generating enzyme family protein [Candidatus Omnitrophota bacterium]